MQTLERVLDHVHAHFGRRLTLAELAAMAGLSPGRFTHVFRQRTGMPPLRYLNQLRIDRACELLRQGMSAAAVADACGFYDQSHFSRHFKQHCAMTPGQYASVDGERAPPPARETYRPPSLHGHAP